ncbi:MAG: peptidylprolyl isomerase [Myxococcales bacterium]|nr:peptidylprolyl isomerase [Myxococcales bacterium]
MAALTTTSDAAALGAALTDPDGPVVATACSRSAELATGPQSLTDAIVARATALATTAATNTDAVEPAIDCFKAAQLLAKGVPDALASAARSSAPAVARLASSAAGLLPEAEPPLPAFPSLHPEPAAKALTVITDAGTFRIALDAENAPATVRHIARLAASRRFNGLSIHRVVPDFVIQTGDPRGDGWGGLSSAIPCENNDLPYVSGSVGMALAGKDTGTSQWFVTHTPHPHLHGTYTQFGRVVSGLDAVDRIVPGDRILTVTVER